MKAIDFIHILHELGIDFVSGVPDSILSTFCNLLDSNFNGQHILAANEGNAIALGVGHYLSTRTPPLIYMQNSGLGNALNPLISLADKSVFDIPLLLLIGFRGQPGHKDEIQHLKQGEITPSLLDLLEIPYFTLSSNLTNTYKVMFEAKKILHQNEKSVALLVPVQTFDKEIKKFSKENGYTLIREKVIKFIIEALPDSIFVSSTGKISRELFACREKLTQTHESDFLTVGSMGHASQIAAVIAKNKINKKIVCLDGDGAVLMHMGALKTIAQMKLKNFIHIMLNNGMHESVGGIQTNTFNINFCLIAKELGYTKTYDISTEKELLIVLEKINSCRESVFIDLKISGISQKDLIRPTISPFQNKKIFMDYLTSSK